MSHRIAVALSIGLLSSTVSAQAQVRLGEPFSLSVGESVDIVDAGIFVGFDRLVYDGRCPIGVLCVWEGNAAVRVWGAPTAGDRTFFDLNSHAQFPNEAPFEGVVIRLLGVHPYPVHGVIVDPSDYRIGMVVVRVESPLPAPARTWGAIKALYRS